MKKLLPLIVVSIFTSLSFGEEMAKPGPFGIKLGMTLAEVKAVRSDLKHERTRGGVSYYLAQKTGQDYPMLGMMRLNFRKGKCVKVNVTIENLGSDTNFADSLVRKYRDLKGAKIKHAGRSVRIDLPNGTSVKISSWGTAGIGVCYTDEASIKAHTDELNKRDSDLIMENL